MDNDEFGTVDLDDLPSNHLDKLEHEAYVSTQRPQQVAEFPRFGQRHDIPPSSNYGIDDEDVVDLDAPTGVRRFNTIPPNPRDEVTQREKWRQQRYAAPSRRETQHPLHRSKVDVKVEPRQPSEPPPSSPNGRIIDLPRTEVGEEGMLLDDLPQDVDRLQARIRQLETERTALQKSAEEARAAVFSKAGEIVIVRANHDKATREHEHRMQSMRKLHAEELEKHKKALDMVKREHEKVETNNRFLEHDLAEKVRDSKRTLKDSHGNSGRREVASPLTTPTKGVPMAFRDGFDDYEMQIISPSKSRSSTPRTNKRKRPARADYNSPTMQLPLEEPERPPDMVKIENLEGRLAKLTSQATEQDVKAKSMEGKLEFQRRLLSFGANLDRSRSIEELTRHHFPSNPSKSLATILLDEIELHLIASDFEHFRRQVCEALISQWSRGLQEKYYDPLYTVTELLQYLLAISPSSLSKTLLAKLVPLCQSTADLVAILIAKASSKGPNKSEPPSDKLRQQINPEDYLHFLLILAMDCENDEDHLIAFWSSMEFDFVLLMLHRAQPLEQIILMLKLLETSILTATFGPINGHDSEAASKQINNELDIADRVTGLLFDRLKLKAEAQIYSPIELGQLRLSALTLLQCMAEIPHGGYVLAKHRFAVGRLVRFLHDSILSLYEYHMQTHELTTELVNNTVLLLSYLTIEDADIVDIRGKLAAIPGGPQKYLISLSRIAFSEGIGIIEEGIDSEVAEAAHRMLDEILSPEEGEAVVKVYSSGR